VSASDATGARVAYPNALERRVSSRVGGVQRRSGDGRSGRLKVTVTGQQFSWTFTYPNGKTYPVLRLPEGRQVLLTLESKDVLHSFWVPQFYQKRDAVLGLPTKLAEVARRVVEQESLLEPTQRQAPAVPSLPADELPAD
jgi:heme/copper-type cytochrome/quinol oxidase subunit 2